MISSTFVRKYAHLLNLSGLVSEYLNHEGLWLQESRGQRCEKKRRMQVSLPKNQSETRSNDSETLLRAEGD